MRAPVTLGAGEADAIVAALDRAGIPTYRTWAGAGPYHGDSFDGEYDTAGRVAIACERATGHARMWAYMSATLDRAGYPARPAFTPTHFPDVPLTERLDRLAAEVIDLRAKLAAATEGTRA